MNDNIISFSQNAEPQYLTLMSSKKKNNAAEAAKEKHETSCFLADVSEKNVFLPTVNFF